MYPNSIPDIMIQAQAVRKVFFFVVVDKLALLYKIPKSKKEDNSAIRSSTL